VLTESNTYTLDKKTNKLEDLFTDFARFSLDIDKLGKVDDF